jgi:zinc transport system substrate-binding protein
MTLSRREVFALLAGAAAAALPARAAGRLRVVGVNSPLAYFARRLAGDAADVIMPVPEGRDPAFWGPSIAEIADVQSADLILLNGAGYSQWTERTSLPRSRTVDTSRAFTGRLIQVEGVVHSHGPEGEHSHAATASITWLDYGQAAEQARAVAEALARRAPEKAAAIETALTELEADLAALDARGYRIGAAAADARLIASHPVYHYFARAYGITIGDLEWEASTTPSDAQWAELESPQNGTSNTVMLWDAEPIPETRQRLAELGVRVVLFPTLANTTEDFVDASHLSLERLEAALSD